MNNNTCKCEKCGSEMVLYNFNFCQCIECGETFLNGLEPYFFFVNQ